MNNRKQNNQPLFAEEKHLTIISAQRGAQQSYKYFLSLQWRTSPNSYSAFGFRCKVTTFASGVVRFCPFLTVMVYRPMQYCSTMNFTAPGGSSLSRGFTPSKASSSLWRTSHLWKVFIETPAAAASWLLLIAFISVSFILMNFQVIFIGRWRYLRLSSKIPSSAIEVERIWHHDSYI